MFISQTPACLLKLLNDEHFCLAAFLWRETSSGVSESEEGLGRGGHLSCSGGVEQSPGVYLCRCKAAHSKFSAVVISAEQAPLSAHHRTTEIFVRAVVQ